LGVEARGPHAEFRLNDGEAWRVVTRCDASHLSYRSAGGFFGVVIGMFASSNGNPESGVADFDWFELSDQPVSRVRSGDDDAAAYPYSTDPSRENS
jgi:alpha-N-arabinofuranosidase